MNDLNIYCPTHGQSENSCIRCKEDERKLTEGDISFIEFLNEKQNKSYRKLVMVMSEKEAIEFNDAMKEYVKKNY